MRKIWDIHGGVHPPENKLQSVGIPIGRIPLAPELVIPLSQHIGAPAQPLVKVGDKVLKGQLIADAQGIFSASVHASTSGTVSAIEDRPIPHPSGLDGPCIVIESDGQDTWVEREPCPEPGTLDHFQLVERVRRAGIAGMGGAGFPTAVKINPRSTDKIQTLILNGTECEPYITADDMLMRECADEIIQGALLLAQILGNPNEILIGIEDNKPEAIQTMQQAAKGTPIEIVVFPTKYPSGGEKQLIQILTGKEVPSGQIPAKLGIVVQNVGTARAVWRAVRYGEPLIERVTTVVGESLKTQQNIWCPIGTPIEHILSLQGFEAQQCARLIIGGPMMGYALDHNRAPVVKTTNCILVPSHAEMPPAPPAQACIRCGLCAEACPANLLPQQLYWYAQAEDNEKLIAHNLMDCIECGACSFVCPSAIPLVQYYRAAKADIRKHDAEKLKSDRARERFERRQERIAKQEAEKEAKRLARKKAAEQAKKKLAEAKPTEAKPTPSTVKPVDPETRRKKLARALSSAQSRMERVQKQLTTAEDDARKDTLTAQLKQAELKVDEAQKKLDAFDKGSDTPQEEKIQQVESKLNASPIEIQQKAVDTLKKRLNVAREKAAQAEAEQKPTAGALQQGEEKLTEKLAEAEKALSELKTQPENPTTSPEPQKDAASAAIERAKAKAQAQASMSPEEKRLNQIESLKSRIKKAQDKLQKAESEKSEHVDAFRNALEKLESKLTQLENENA